MAKNITKDLKFELGTKDKPVNVVAFLEMFHNTVLALKDIEKEISTSGASRIEWQIVEAGSNSPVFATIQGSVNGDVDKSYCGIVIDSFVEGIKQLNRDDSCPKYFNQQSLSRVSKIVSQSSFYQLRTAFSVNDQTIELKKVAARNAHWAKQCRELGAQSYIEHGSVEGFLQILSATKKLKDKLSIVDALTEHTTQCYPRDQERLEPKIRESWKRRVVLEGEITVDRHSRLPKKILFDEIRIFPEQKDLPQIDDMRGIDITGGIEPSEYIRGLRDGC